MIIRLRNPLGHLALRPFRSSGLRLILATAVLFLSAHSLPPPAADTSQPPPEAAFNISADQAISAALNQLSAVEDGYRLHNPRFQARFSDGGVSFALPGETLDWQWSLEYLGAEGGAAPALQAVRPVEREQGVVAYSRLGWEERYLPGSESLEQQFVLHQPLPLGGRDLVIAGRVQGSGEFQEVEDGWLWADGHAGVWMGAVRVYDALGAEIPVTMQAWQDGTRIVVDGAALSAAIYPVTVDPEIGPGDFRISAMGRSGSYSAGGIDLAYNSTDQEYLVVFIKPNAGHEIYARRVNAKTGEVVGAELPVSDMGPVGDENYIAGSPAVAYNLNRNEYLVIWTGDDNTGGLVNNEYEIFGQRLSGSTGAPVGSDDFRLSDMGPDGDVNYRAYFPDVAWNATSNEYLVVWDGDDNTDTVDEEFEIFAQRVDGVDGHEIGSDTRLSDMGVDDLFGDYTAHKPAVAWNSHDNQYLVVWEADDDGGSLVDGEFEIYGQVLDASAGSVYTNDFRLSDMGPDGDVNFNASRPDVAYNSVDNQYLVVWYGDSAGGGLVDQELEIFGQRLSAAGAELGDNDFRISDMGPNGDTGYDAFYPAVTFSHSLNQYLVVWFGDDGPAGEEVFAQRLNASGGEIGENDFQISYFTINDVTDLAVVYNSEKQEYLAVWMQLDDYSIIGQRLDAPSGVEVGDDDFCIVGQYNDTWYDASDPAVAYNSLQDEYFVVWSGDDNWYGEDGKDQIYGSRVDAVTGKPLSLHLLSQMGPEEDINYDAYDPDVAYNDTNDEYYVVWYGDSNTASLVNEEYEIWGQRVSGADGTEVGLDMQLCSMGGLGDVNYDAYHPAIAYNHTSNEYLVVWHGDEISGALVEGEYEVFGQRINAVNGSQVGTNDFRISSMGSDGNANYDATAPDVAWNSHSNQYLVVWRGDHNSGTLADDEYEIFAMRMNSTGGFLGFGQFRLSDMGTDGNAAFDAYDPAVAYGAFYQQYLVVWYGDDSIGTLVDGEYEIFGQSVDPLGNEAGTNDFRISQMGPDGDVNYDAQLPGIAYNASKAEFLVTWYADDNQTPLVNDETEIFGQRLNGTTGAQVGQDDFRLSDMGPDGDTQYDGYLPAAACQTGSLVCLVVWQGDDNRPPLIEGEIEIFGQFYSLADTIYLPRLAK